ncbi:MAG: type II toxin-antitoxin system RelE/ParE family toxin [Gammaproteobacteria bacterium]|nr:type II toxin-antitoxin system RelE/ParE family toxin [Gammaproteobacteria bacterium]
MIQSTRGKLILAVLDGCPGKGFPAEVFDIAARKVTMLAAAQTLNDLRAPPANRLKVLKGNRKGQHSIRINDQWRICFIWTNQGPADVEITDYH